MQTGSPTPQPLVSLRQLQWQKSELRYSEGLPVRRWARPRSSETGVEKKRGQESTRTCALGRLKRPQTKSKGNLTPRLPRNLVHLSSGRSELALGTGAGMMQYFQKVLQHGSKVASALSNEGTPTAGTPPGGTGPLLKAMGSLPIMGLPRRRKSKVLRPVTSDWELIKKTNQKFQDAFNMARDRWMFAPTTCWEETWTEKTC